jgi:hypothetical protein
MVRSADFIMRRVSAQIEMLLKTSQITKYGRNRFGSAELRCVVKYAAKNGLADNRQDLIVGGRYWDRTSDPCRVKAVLYR